MTDKGGQILALTKTQEAFANTLRKKNRELSVHVKLTQFYDLSLYTLSSYGLIQMVKQLLTMHFKVDTEISTELHLVMAIWCQIWRERNDIIFNGITPSFFATCDRILRFWKN